ncbi:MAG TPA: glycosyltransferase family 2 protein [Candidatus Nitrosocosmicus sp.]
MAYSQIVIISGFFLNIFFSILVIGSSAIWTSLFFALKKSFHSSPHLLKKTHPDFNKIFLSIIIPVRNEEKFIKQCLSSLLEQQSFNNYEIIVVDDGSSDNTMKILEFFKNDPRIKIFEAGEKPDDWVGKNWPCYIGYKKSRGQVLLFTDADTIHSPQSIHDSLNTFLFEKLDVLTAVPNLIYPSFMVKMVLPILSIFMFSRYSPLRVNDPKIKLGYLFGSFFIISKKVYEKIGTHESVKAEIVEDGALGQKIKDSGYRLRMFRGEKIISAYWARDFSTLWNSLKRLIIPIYFNNKKNSILMTVGVFMLMLLPFIICFYSVVCVIYIKDMSITTVLLFIFSIASILSVYLTNYYQLKRADTHNVLYSVGSPLGCFVVSISFIYSILSSEKNGVVKWRDRIYNYNKI